MKSSEIFEKIFFNWHIKLLCFVVAILFYIFYQSSFFEKKNFVIPLNVIENGLVMNVGNIDSKINVVIKGTPETISLVQTNKISASIDLSNITENGKHSLPVLLTISDDLLALDPLEVRIQPETINVQVERRDFKYLDIEPSIVGNIAYGYEITDYQVEPAFAEIQGSISMINKISTIKTEMIDITDKDSSFETNVYLKSINNQIKIVKKGPYKINFNINPIKIEKDFKEVSIMPVLLQEGFMVLEELPKINFTLKGTMLNLEDYNVSENTVKINLSEITSPGEYEVPLVYSIPSYFEIIETSIDKIKINIVPAPIEETTETLEEGIIQEGKIS